MDNPTPPTEQISYFDKRMQELGVTEENNRVSLGFFNIETKENDRKDYPIFSKVDEGIKIIVYTIGGNMVNYAKEGSRYKINEYYITRLEKPIVKKDGSLQKYALPPKQSTYPFFPPLLLDYYRNKTKLETLVLTEGYFKAFKAAMHGIPCVGLASITTLKNKETGDLHEDILDLIKVCQVKRVIWLHDGDCTDISKDISTKDGNNEILKDLYKRPFNFFRSVQTFYELCSRYEHVEPYFAHINSHDIDGNPKGLDDLLIAFPDKAEEIKNDLFAYHKNNSGKYHGNYFIRFNLNMVAMNTLRKHFYLHDVTEFYLHHIEHRKELENKEFVFNGTRYKYDYVKDKDKNECVMVVHGDSANYFRVTDTYFQFIDKPNKYGQLEKQFIERKAATIKSDYKSDKNFIDNIPKYLAFCTVPDHVNYQQSIHGCFNIYSPFEHEILEGECETSFAFVKHIFGTNKIKYKPKGSDTEIEIYEYDLGLDYIQLLFQRPQQVLPILCLVSQERQTGKTTFAKWLKEIFRANMAIVGNSDLKSEFNSHWATKLIVCCDETKIDKAEVLEKVKALSTADRIMMNTKGVKQTEMELFAKFMLLSNNEETFLAADEDEIRFWVRKVPPIIIQNVDLIEDLIDEIPAFLYRLNKRKLATEHEERHWFNTKLLRTEAWKKVVERSKPTLEKEIKSLIKEMFNNFEEDIIWLTMNNLKEMFPRFETNYLEHILEDRLKVSRETVQRRYHWKFVETKQAVLQKDGSSKEELVPEKLKINTHGRHFVFHRHDFIAPSAALVENVSSESNSSEDDLPF